MVLEFFFTLVTGITALKWDTLLKIVGTLAFINTFLSLAITQTFSRKAFISKRWALLLTLVLLWSAVIGVLIDMVVTLKSDDKSQKMVVRGLEKVPWTSEIDYSMNCRNSELGNTPP